MIYLFDEARERQKGYLWNAERFDGYASAIKPIYSFEEYRLIKREVFSPGNIILYHESFSLNQTSKHDKDSIQIINDLSTYAKENGLLVAYFSGSEQDRRLDDDIAHLPVSYLYDNLECFIKHVENNETDLKYLLYGENFEIEREISELLNEEISKVDYSVYDSLNKTDKSIFVINTFDEYKLTANVDESFKETIFSDDVSDKELDGYVKDWLNNREYDAIIIPLCFGNSLSDFNGLRLATHIRCTDTINRLKPIFLFGIQRHELMLSSPYYDILKTKDVSLVGYDFRKIEETIDGYCGTLSENELPIEMGKMNVSYCEDGHSVANEWAIYRWYKMLPQENIVDRSGIDTVISKVSHNLYFKFLATKYPVTESNREGLCLKIGSITSDMGSDREELLIEDPRILYVDDEAEKGWFELFDVILGENNTKLYVDYLMADDFNEKNPDEIITMILNKIKNERFNIIVLDFRLHPSDFHAKVIDEITGYKALCEIKKQNVGIQVIVFSATNKIWNLQKLQKKGADGFIIKESPINSVDEKFTRDTIQSFVNELDIVVSDRFKSQFYEDCRSIIANLRKYNPETDDFEQVIKLFLRQFELIVKSIPIISSQDSGSIDIAYISCYNVFECLKEFYLKKDRHNKYSLGEECGMVYKMEESNYKNHIHKKHAPQDINSLFKDNGEAVRPTLFDCIGSLLFYFALAERRIKDPHIEDLWDIIRWRNDFIHGNKAHFTSEELMVMVQLCREISENMRA